MDLEEFLPEDGFCVKHQRRRPKICRWCTSALRLVRGRAVICPWCDEIERMTGE